MNIKHELSPPKPLLRSTLSLILGFTVPPLCSSFFQTMKAHWTMISQIVSLEMMAIKKEPAYFFPRHWWLSCLKRVSPYFKGFRISRPFSLLGDLTTVFVKKKKSGDIIIWIILQIFFSKDISST